MKATVGKDSDGLRQLKGGYDNKKCIARLGDENGKEKRQYSTSGQHKVAKLRKHNKQQRTRGRGK